MSECIITEPAKISNNVGEQSWDRITSEFYPDWKADFLQQMLSSIVGELLNANSMYTSRQKADLTTLLITKLKMLIAECGKNMVNHGNTL